MKPRTLSAEQRELMWEVIVRHLPDSAERLSHQSPAAWVLGDRVAVREAVGLELAATGFGAEWEPTPRGYVLEDVISFLNRLEFPDFGETP